MAHYLVSYSVFTQTDHTLVTAGVVPVQSDTAITINEIERYFDRYYSGGEQNVLFLTNVQRITEDDFNDYGGRVTIET
jgi:hypothetical protein